MDATRNLLFDAFVNSGHWYNAPANNGDKCPTTMCVLRESIMRSPSNIMWYHLLIHCIQKLQGEVVLVLVLHIKLSNPAQWRRCAYALAACSEPPECEKPYLLHSLNEILLKHSEQIDTTLVFYKLVSPQQSNSFAWVDMCRVVVKHMRSKPLCNILTSDVVADDVLVAIRLGDFDISLPILPLQKIISNISLAELVSGFCNFMDHLRIGYFHEHIFQHMIKNIKVNNEMTNLLLGAITCPKKLHMFAFATGDVGIITQRGLRITRMSPQLKFDGVFFTPPDEVVTALLTIRDIWGVQKILCTNRLQMQLPRVVKTEGLLIDEIRALPKANRIRYIAKTELGPLSDTMTIVFEYLNSEDLQVFI